MDLTRGFGEKYLEQIRKFERIENPTDEDKSSLLKASSQFLEYMLEGIGSISNILSLDGITMEDRDSLSILLNELTMFSMDALAVNNGLNPLLNKGYSG